MCSIHCFLSFLLWPFYGFGANHKHPLPPSPPLFSPPLFSILAPLSTWHVLWHLWNGDPGVWQASPVETQRHEKEGQALLALRAACTYCTFIQIAHNCNVDLAFGWFPFLLFLFVLFYSGIIKEAMTWTLFAPAFWDSERFVLITGNKEWEPLPCSKMTKNGDEW